MRFAFLGTFLVGPVIHRWYSFLAKQHLIKSSVGSVPFKVVVAQRVLVDQFMFAPFFNAAWLSCLRILESLMADARTGITVLSNYHSTATTTTIQNLPIMIGQEVPAIVVANWVLWIPAQTVNFAFVKLPYQVLYSNVVALLWNVYLSQRTASSSSFSSFGPMKQ
jgi:protein Mpv17